MPETETVEFTQIQIGWVDERHPDVVNVRQSINGFSGGLEHAEEYVDTLNAEETESYRTWVVVERVVTRTPWKRVR